MPLFRSSPPFVWSRDASGLAIVFADRRVYERARNGRADEKMQLAWLRMRLLLEQGDAEEGEAHNRELSRGIFLVSEQSVRLDEETRELFNLPCAWPGSFRLEVRGVPHEPDFSAPLLLRDAGGRDIRNWQLTGPILEVGGEHYLPLPEQYAVLRSIADWNALSFKERDEYANLLLLARLNAAREAGCQIDLDAFTETKVEAAGDFEVEARESGNGELFLVPRFAGALEKFSADEIEQRLHQLRGDAARTVLRIQNRNASRIVLLNEEQTQRARELIRNRRVPAGEREAFLRDPASWLAGHVFPDVDTEFCPRVTGVEIWNARYFGAALESGIDWFDRKPEAESANDKSGANSSKEANAGKDNSPPTDDERDSGGPVVLGIHDNDEQRTFGRDKLSLAAAQEESANIDSARYSRRPLPHQMEAIGWLLAHAQRILPKQPSLDKNDPGGGVLLADDMGLGKTFSTLVFLGEWIRRARERGSEPEAALVVAPVTLIENWRGEIAKSYPDPNDVFRRVTYAYPEGDLARFKTPEGRDDAEPGEGDPSARVRSWGLIFGTGTPESVDYPGTLVFTTYATLRNYRFSFGACRWSVAVFDEAQNLKNPNALQTVAAKALNARYRILATGTPVENHLGDFWSLLDLAEPGFLDSFQAFRRNYIAPLLANRERVFEIGRKLHTTVGSLMLRRLKDEILQGLPRKAIILHDTVRAENFDSRITSTMHGVQRELYDQALDAARTPLSEPVDVTRQQNRLLGALWHLREVTLHPALLGGGRLPIGSNAAECERILRESAKLGTILDILAQIRASGEKVLVFAVNKRLQEGLAGNLVRIFGFDIPVINGDSPTGTRSQRPEAKNRTRFGMIESFQSADGFRVCILSPLAAGVGLTITAANHVIHLERHWNPAKEAQATDRVYRIGQKLPVYVHVPILLHPERASYDVNLDRLLRSKMQLQDALTIAAPDEVGAGEMMDEMFKGSEEVEQKTRSKRTLRSEDVLVLSWELFEALVAELYAREAREVILTPKSADHGCDVVVLGHSEVGNVLIQCKHTSAKTYEGDAAIREVASSRAYYEHRTGERFSQLAVHSPCRDFSRQAREASQIHGVQLHGLDWFRRKLGLHTVSHAEVLRRSSSRRAL